MDTFYEEVSLAKKRYLQHLENVQAIAHLLDPIQMERIIRYQNCTSKC